MTVKYISPVSCFFFRSKNHFARGWKGGVSGVAVETSILSGKGRFEKRGRRLFLPAGLCILLHSTLPCSVCKLVLWRLRLTVLKELITPNLITVLHNCKFFNRRPPITNLRSGSIFVSL